MADDTQFITRAGQDYLSDAWGFLDFRRSLLTIEEAALKVRLARIRHTLPDDATEIERMFASMNQRTPFILQMLFCRVVDNFLAYISDLLTLIFTNRPETLRSSEKVRVDFLLRHTDMQQLVHALVERKVHELSFQSMADLASDLNDKLGFALFDKKERLDRCTQLVEIRNLIVHNRARVNRRFKGRYPDFSADIGDEIELTSDQVDDYQNFFTSAAEDIDTRAISKFKLPSNQCG
jgi:hypothetical protein